MYSDALRILDQGTVKYMIDELRAEITKMGAELSKKDSVIFEKDSELSEKDSKLSQKDSELSKKDFLISAQQAENELLRKRLAQYESQNAPANPPTET